MDKKSTSLNPAKKIGVCKKCKLWKSRINAIPGEGPRNAKIMIIGEAPGRQEEKQGMPFVGLAGKRLNKILEKNNLDRKKIYITNVVKFRPPQNRRPTEKEIKKSMPQLKKEIGKIKPKLIILLGKTACNAFFPDFKFPELRGKFIKKEKITFFPTYHPSAARFTKIREKLEDDFAKLRLFSL